VRVVHLIQPCSDCTPHDGRFLTNPDALGSDAAVLACRETIEAAHGVQHEVLVFGNGEAQRRAVRLGVFPTARVSPPLNRNRFAATVLRAFLASHGPYGLVQAWGAGFTGLVEHALPRHWAWGLADFERGWIRGSAQASDEVLLRVLPANPRALCPTPEPRTSARRRLGVEDSEILVLAAGDPAGLVDASLFVYFLAILSVAGFRVVGAIPRGASNIGRAVRHLRGGGYARSIRVFDDPSLLLADAADLAVAAFAPAIVRFPPISARLEISRFVSIGLPVVVPDVPSLRELVASADEACVAASCRPSDLARSAVRLLSGGAPPGVRRASHIHPDTRPRVDEVVTRFWEELGQCEQPAHPDGSSKVLVA